MATNSNRGTANDIAWGQILADDPTILERIESQGFHDIKSGDINPYTQSRLACKFDFREQLPKPLKNEKLSVLAIRNGLYRIARTNTFIDLPTDLQSAHHVHSSFVIPSHIKTLSPSGISSESKALDAALVSGMLNHVFDDEVSLVLRGRERSSNFTFQLKNESENCNTVLYEVNQVQIEVDGGYEGEKGIYLVEAKNKVNNNINLRQLLYPQLHFEGKFGTHKPVQTYVLLYDEPQERYHFTRLKILNDSHGLKPLSLHLVDHVECGLKVESEPTRNYWDELLAVKVDVDLLDSDRPFPQANDFGKVFATYLRLADEGEISKDDLFEKYSIQPGRQYDYYGNVLRWLRVAKYDANTQTFNLSPKGRRLRARGSNKETLFELARIVLANDIFNQCLHDGAVGVSSIARQRNRLEADSTFRRRLSTVSRWLTYFKNTLGDPVG